MKRHGSRRDLLRTLRQLEARCTENEALLTALALAAGGTLDITHAMLAAVTDETQYALQRVGGGVRFVTKQRAVESEVSVRFIDSDVEQEAVL